MPLGLLKRVCNHRTCLSWEEVLCVELFLAPSPGQHAACGGGGVDDGGAHTTAVADSKCAIARATVPPIRGGQRVPDQQQGRFNVALRQPMWVALFARRPGVRVV